MPYAWVKPPVFVEGITGCRTIYHAYRNNDAGDMLLRFWYGVDHPHLGTLYFDARDLPKYKSPLVGATELPGAHVTERYRCAERIISAMRDPGFDFMEWLSVHGCEESEL